MTTKAAPKTFNQLRNVFYIFAISRGLTKGCGERDANNAAWDTYRKAQWKEAHDKHEALHPAPVQEVAPGDIPAAVPVELHGLYKTFQQ